MSNESRPSETKPREKIALVTGANRGIGFETCKQLRDLGYTVLLAARDRSKAQQAVESLGHTSLHPLQLDVTNEQHRQAAALHIERTFGKLDVLINNAGVMPKADTSADKVSLDILRETFETNFFAVVALTEALLPLLRKSAAGRIV
ncbi:MAG: SDR family NAD(P)-dependent oxidoreductase, partial [Acidobacteriales bacterium]|nr:SDR family NAD(P)-dependent oxidoreductase [Terriglobales bacterium]